MKELIKKADGSPVKSKIHAYQFLNKIGLDKTALIEENGQFFYEDFTTKPDLKTELLNGISEEDIQRVKESGILERENEFKPVSWEVEVFDKDNERTKLFIPGTDVIATIIGKHPAGQNRAKSAFEINIGSENFIMSVDLLSKIFKVRG